MELRREQLVHDLLDPRHGFESRPTSLEIRWDPLTGNSARIMGPSSLIPPSDFDLRGLAEQTRTDCPFCRPALDSATPRLPPHIDPAGRILRGEAVLFPNLLAYSKHAVVSVYSPDRHYLPLEEITPRLIADNLAAHVDFERAVLATDPDSAWAWIDANHMLPSGSSVFHPHLQGGMDPFPTTAQRMLAAVPAERFDDYLRTERDLGDRYLGSTGSIEWLAAFAPVGPADIRAFVPGVASPVELPEDRIDELGRGIATALALYAELGYQSFNLALYGAPPGGTAVSPLSLRMVARQTVQPLYRSDVTHLERLHWEGAVDVSPEDLARRAGDRFRW